MIRQRISLAVALAVYQLERLRNLGKPRSLQEIRGWASLELMSNPTITRYRFVDGAEVDRRPANPFAGLTDAMDQIKEAFQRFGNQILISMAREHRKLKP